MADETFVIDELATGGATITLSDDASGIDTLKFSGLYDSATDITLAWTTNSGLPTSASGLYFNSTGGHRLVVNGVIENAIGSNGRDFIQGNAIANLILGDNATTGAGLGDTLWAGADTDTVHGGSGDDQILGDDGNDLLFGDDGSDTISGGAGSDTVQGGIGADNLAGGATAGDTISYSTSAAGVSIDITFGSFTTGTGGDAAGDTLGGFVNATGSGFDDVITDTVAGQVAFGGNDNRFDGGAGNDLLTMGGGVDQAYGGTDNDTLNGGAQDDRLFGGLGNDSLFGGLDNDHLNGGIGADTMTGGAGNDTFVANAATDIVVEAVGEGRDLVLSAVNWSLSGNLEDLTLTASAITGQGNGGANVVTGNAQANRLNGGGGHDTLNGAEGNDSLFGGDGNDLLQGGLGADTMTGGLGDDTYFANGHTDIVVEAVDGGHDLMNSAVSWTLQGTLEDLTLTGTAEIGQGNNLGNELTGNIHANLLRGFGGADTIRGGGGRDTLDGGLGDDRLVGGKGNDTVLGGTGADRFVFEALSDLIDTQFGNTEDIVDFSSAEGDVIDLSGVDARSGVPGNQTFTFIGEAAFSGHKGELRAEGSPDGTSVEGDIDGDGQLDFRISVYAVPGLIDADFLL